VVGCSNSSVKGFRMHRFPRDPVRTKIWAVNVARPNWAPTKRSEICNVSFEDLLSVNRSIGHTTSVSLCLTMCGATKH